MTYRIFATRVIGDYATMQEWSELQAPHLDEIRGGGGDELYYDELTGRFGLSEKSGEPILWLDNPFPDDLIRGAVQISCLVNMIIEGELT